MRILIAAMFMAAVGAGWAQDVEKGEKGKETPRPKAEAGKDGKDGAGAGFLSLDQVDTNGDGKVTRAELEAALKKLGGVREGDKKAPPKAEGTKDGVKEGDKKAPPKPEGARDGEKKAPPKPDGAKEGDK